MTVPLTLSAVVLIVLAVRLSVGRRSRVAPDPAMVRARQFAAAVRPRLSPAMRRAQMATVGAQSTWQEPSIRDVGPVAGGLGWAWHLTTPGGSTVADIRDALPRITSAVNTPRPLVAVMDVTPTRHEGHATLRAYRVDPIVPVRPISEVLEPGGRLMSGPHGRATVGVHRWGDVATIPLFEHSMLVCGQTRRGKTSASLTVLANLLPLVADELARVRFVDCSIKAGRGYGWAKSAGWFHSFETSAKGAMGTLEAMAADLQGRSSTLAGDDSSVRLSRRMPLDVLLIEEGPAFLEVKGAAAKLTALGRQVAGLGGVVVLVSQGAKEVPIELRRTLPTRVGFAVADDVETRNLFDSSSWSGGPGPHTIPVGDEWRGVSYVDVDGAGLSMVRWFFVDPSWITEHARALG